MTAIETLFREPLAQAIGWALLHFVWQGALIGVLAGLALRLLRTSAADVRYVVAAIALALMATLPAVTGVQAYRVAVRNAPLATPSQVLDSAATAPTSKTTAHLEANPSATDFDRIDARTGNSTRLDITVQSATPTITRESIEGWLPVMVAIWLAGVVVLTLRLIGGWIWVQRIKSHGALAAPLPLQAMVARLSKRLHISRPVTLLQSTGVDVPTVIGSLKPVILLPVSALAGLSLAQTEAILAHEMAHIRRHDYLVNLLQTLLETVLFYHPAVWWLSRRIRDERENCCDDLAVSLCGDPVTYARALADLEQQRGSGAILAMAASGGPLMHRVRRLLIGVPSSHAGRGPVWLAGITALLLTAGVGATVATNARGLQSPVPVPAVAPQTPAPPVSPAAPTPVVAAPALTTPASPIAAPAPTAPSSAVPLAPSPAVPPAPSPAMPPAPSPAMPSAPSSAVMRAPSPALTHAPSPALAPTAALALTTVPTPTLAPTPISLESQPQLPTPATPAPPASPAPPAAPSGSGSSSSHSRTVDGQRSHGNMTWSKDGEKIEVRYDGEFEFTDDDMDVKTMSPGGQLRISDGGWLRGHSVEFTADASGKITRKYWLGSTERPFEPEGRQWLSQKLPRFVRQSGIGAKARAARIYKSQGAQGLLAEISRIEGGWAKKVYFTELFAMNIDANTARQALEQAGREINSDYELATLLIDSGDRLVTDDATRKAYFDAVRTIQSDYEMRRVYAAGLKRGPVNAATLAGILDASREIQSDYEQAELLVQIAKLQSIEQVRQPFFAALGTIDSDYEHRRVLSALGARTDLGGETTAAMLKSSANLKSDYEQAEFLLQMAKQSIEGPQRVPFFAALETIGGGYERGRVLQTILKRSDLSEESLMSALQSASTMQSGYELSQVLQAAARNHRISGPARDLYIRAADRLGEYEQSQALAALVRSERGK